MGTNPVCYYRLLGALLKEGYVEYFINVGKPKVLWVAPLIYVDEDEDTEIINNLGKCSATYRSLGPLSVYLLTSEEVSHSSNAFTFRSDSGR